VVEATKVIFDFDQRHDSPVNLPNSWDISSSYEVDYDNLTMRFMELPEDHRVIYHDYDLDQNEINRWKGDDFVEYYFAFDDDHERNPYKGYEDKKLAEERQCRRTSWHRNYKINCNAFHELDLASSVLTDHSKFLG
jgi:hypothetical protein